MKRKRRKFTKEFKEEAVRLVLEAGYQISEVSRNLGIHTNLLGRWKEGTLMKLAGVQAKQKKKFKVTTQVSGLI